VCDVICNEAVPFRPYCAGVATRTRNVSEYMLVLALCLVCYCFDTCFLAIALASFSACKLLRGVFLFCFMFVFECIVLPVELNNVVQYAASPFYSSDAIIMGKNTL